MPRVRRPPAPPPPQPTVAVRTLPTGLRAKAKWVDEQFGNKDGVLSMREVAAYERAFGSEAGHAHTIAQLKQQLELGDRPVVASPAVTADAAAAARALVRTGGSGTAHDAAVVAAELARLPVELLRKLDGAGVKVVACRGSITDHLADLRGVRPRGWPPGATWDSVPAVYSPERNEVVVATIDGPNGARELPDSGHGHGSFNAVFHEVGHAIDGHRVLGADSQGAAFCAAYAADRGALEANHEDYLLQPGLPGAQETFSEVAARFFGHDPGLRTTYPNLERFFSTACRDAGIPS